VKMYTYSSNVTESTLLMQLNAADSNYTALAALVSQAQDTLNLTFAPRSGVYLDSAKQYYADKSYSLSYESAATAIAYAQADTAIFGGAISATVLSRISVMSDAIAGLKNATFADGYTPDFNSVESLMASSKSKLAAGDFSGGLADYASASDKITEISSKTASSAASGTSGTVSNGTASGDDRLATEIRLAQVSASFDSFRQRSALYKQNATYDDVSGALAVARAQLAAGSVAQANATISAASNLLSGYSSALEQKVPDIDAALKNISLAETQVNAIGQQGYFIHPDITSAKAKIEAAKALAYSSPSDGIAMAAGAIDDAKSQTGREFLVIGGAVLAMIIVAIAVAGTVAYFAVKHFKGRRKGL
ncbi:MAG TPA: hypothetical protein PLO51_02975, partial [Candidatus Micrarchaeota archaeon]|nr:hypothetical protein [Candidatus Micrarchaeota archaeon]